MGFYFDSYEKDKKQHINLSESAWCVVEQDIKNFYLDEAAESKSGFFNTVLANYYELADASINLRCSNKKEELNSILSDIVFKNLESSTKISIINGMVDVYKNELINKAFNYPKGHGDKFRITRRALI